MKQEKPPPPVPGCSMKDYTLCFIAVGIVGGFFFINWQVVTGNIPVDNDTNVTTILNYTNSLVIFVAGYFFGASKSGNDSNQMMADVIGGGTGPGTTTTAVVTSDKTTLKTEPTKPPSAEGSKPEDPSPLTPKPSGE